MRSALAALTAWSLFASAASADQVGPDDHLCTLELQQRDGSQCGECSSSVQDRMAGRPDPCASFVQRGWTERCGVGATHRRTIYCDRVADFRSVGSGPCGCRAAGIPSRFVLAWPLAALLFVRRPGRRYPGATRRVRPR